MDGSRVLEKQTIGSWILTTKCMCQELHYKLGNINLLNVTPLLNPKTQKEQMLLV